METLTGVILWIIFGAFVGWVASIIMKTNSQQGSILNIIVGIIGSVLGGWLMMFFGQESGGGINLYSFLVALIGAVVFIGLVKAFRPLTR